MRSHSLLLICSGFKELERDVKQLLSIAWHVLMTIIREELLDAHFLCIYTSTTCGEAWQPAVYPGNMYLSNIMLLKQIVSLAGGNIFNTYLYSIYMTPLNQKCPLQCGCFLSWICSGKKHSSGRSLLYLFSSSLLSSGICSGAKELFRFC